MNEKFIGALPPEITNENKSTGAPEPIDDIPTKKIPPPKNEGLNSKIKLLGLATLLGLSSTPEFKEVPPKTETIELAARRHHKEKPETKLSNDPFKKYPKGEFSKEEMKARTKKLADGVIIFQDIGLSFYQVQKGDTVDEIIRKLIKTNRKKYLYLMESTEKEYSFNILNSALKAGYWIPIPIPFEERIISDQDFQKQAEKALKLIRDNPHYGPAIKGLISYLKKLELDPNEEIISAITAIAKQETGPDKIGRTNPRHEPRADMTSYSYLEVMLHNYWDFQKGIPKNKLDPGDRARQKLGMTIGQTLNAQNGTELFLASLVEKGKETIKLKHRDRKGKITNTPYSLRDFFPLAEKTETFATVYNGNWQKFNPDYPSNLRRFLVSTRNTYKQNHPPKTYEQNNKHSKPHRRNPGR